MNKKIILINQVTGPLFIDIANQYLREYSNVTLITGSIEQTYAPLNKKIKILLKQKYIRKNSFLRVFTWVYFFIQTYIHLKITKTNYDKALLVSNPPILPFLGSFLFKKKKIKFDILIYDVYPDTLSNFGYLKKDSLLFMLGID